MKSRLMVVLVIMLSCLVVAVAYEAASSSLPFSKLVMSTVPDGTDPPHAVDIGGRVLPESSTMIPDKPIILSKDSDDPKWGEHKPEAAFDHTKHTTDVKHSLDGKTVTACVECHHTEQPSAPPGQEYLKRFERKEALSAKQLEASKEPVRSCRACHYQSASEETNEFPPKGVTYPKKTGKQPTGKLTNDVAYHINCNSCHDAAMKKDPTLKAPQACGDCHIKKS
jgi:cytochrome c553